MRYTSDDTCDRAQCGSLDLARQKVLPLVPSIDTTVGLPADIEKAIREHARVFRRKKRNLVWSATEDVALAGDSVAEECPTVGGVEGAFRRLLPCLSGN